MKKIVIVMTYFERPYQLRRTLDSLKNTKYTNFEVIIVDDSSNQAPYIGSFNFPVKVLRTQNKRWTNPEPAYNLGIQAALDSKPDIIMLQNAECYHVGDVISRAAIIEPDEYLTFGCFSLDQKTTFSQHDIIDIIKANDICAKYDGQLAWYNHSRHRPVAYEFCSAIHVSRILELNGYDERLADGCGYGDNYLLDRIKMLGMRVGICDLPFVVHQWHETTRLPNKAVLIERNKLLRLQLLRLGDPRAKHIYTQDLSYEIVAD